MVDLFSLRQWCCVQRVSCRRRAGADERAKASKRTEASKEPGAAREAGPVLRSRSAAADIVCHLSRWGGAL
jgi:hypothetical protein